MVHTKYIRELLLVGIYTLGFLGIVASGGGGGGGNGDGNDNDGGVNLNCATTTVLLGPLIDDQVGLSTTNCYSYATSPGDNLTIAIVGLTGDADLIVPPPETCIRGTTEIAGTFREHCTITATGNQITLAVIGIEAAMYTLFVSEAPAIALPMNESASIAIDTPTVGQVGTRGESFYMTSGIAPGTYNVSISGLTGGASLHVYQGASYGFELDCTLRFNRQDCTESFTDPIYFSVSSTPLNRDGAAYVILVH